MAYARHGDVRFLSPSILSSPSARPDVVLVVDDEPDILESLGELIQAGLPNIQVRTAPSGDAALSILGHESVDLIVSDFKMPGMNGLQFLEKARGLVPNVPRIMMTAYPDLDLAVSAINEARIDQFVTKPFDPEKMLGVIRDTLAARRAKAQRDQAMARAMDEARKKGGPP